MTSTFILEDEILREHSRRQAEKIAAWVGNDRRRFGKLMELFLTGDHVVTQRAAWSVGVCADRRPALALPYLRHMLDRMNQPGVHDAVRRNVLRILQYIDIPPGLEGRIATTCFAHLTAGDAPVAVKVFAMTVIARIADTKPELGRELRLVIEQQLPYAGGGFRSRAARVLAALDPGMRAQRVRD